MKNKKKPTGEIKTLLGRDLTTIIILESIILAGLIVAIVWLLWLLWFAR